MGCAESKNETLLDRLRERFPKTLSILELQQYSTVLAEKFLAFDKSGDSTLSYSEFILMCKIPENRVTKRLFAICDMDGTVSLDFREACYALWQLCTLDHDGLKLFLFDLYDEFNNGAIEYDDVERMLSDSYGSGNLSNEDMQGMITFVKEEGVLDRRGFERFCVRCPQVLKQLVDVQKSMRQQTLGPQVWLKLEERRSRKTDPLYRPENWCLLMERIIVMDIETRIEKERMLLELEARTGKRAKRINVKGNGAADADADDFEKYEP
jgi:Ca2+-binding EF-hand superfamily protein